MGEQVHPSFPPLTSEMQALWERIKRENPQLRIVGTQDTSSPSLTVADPVTGLVVSFRSEQEYVRYCQLILGQEVQA